MKKVCIKCHKIKPVEVFAPAKNYISGRQNICNPCAWIESKFRKTGKRKFYGTA